MAKKRKREHVENYLKTSFQGDTLFGDVFLEHNALPELDFSEISTETNFLGKAIDYPMLINAMTGGTEFSQEINKKLSLLAKEYNIAMAVGSESIVLCEDDVCRRSFEIVRENIGADGIVLANLNAKASLEDVEKALELIDGDGIQLHLNTAQELSMEAGDRNFTGVYENIQNIIKNIDKPVIVKEFGFGISKSVAEKLSEAGVEYIDISGHGGTNFVEIENLKNMNIDLSELYSWGIPTALSLIKCKEAKEDLKIISSGGIKNSKDVVKSIVLGADMVGVSGELLSYLVHGGYNNAKNYLDGLLYKLKMIMMLLGKKDIEGLKEAPYKITGKLKELI